MGAEAAGVEGGRRPDRLRPGLGRRVLGHERCTRRGQEVPRLVATAAQGRQSQGQRGVVEGTRRGGTGRVGLHATRCRRRVRRAAFHGSGRGEPHGVRRSTWCCAGSVRRLAEEPPGARAVPDLHRPLHRDRDEGRQRGNPGVEGLGRGTEERAQIPRRYGRDPDSFRRDRQQRTARGISAGIQHRRRWPRDHRQRKPGHRGSSGGLRSGYYVGAGKHRGEHQPDGQCLARSRCQSCWAIRFHDHLARLRRT